MEDKFLIPFIEPLMLEIRSKVLRKIVKPYKSIRLNFISKHLNVPDSEVEAIVMRLVMDGMLVGKLIRLTESCTWDQLTRMKNTKLSSNGQKT